jgi:hypothetical protein
MTICWHVDDLLIGHVDSSVVTTFLSWLASRYDTADKKLNVTRGPRHDYLGMNIDFSEPGSVTFDMIPYISKILTGFPEKLRGCLPHRLLITCLMSALNTRHLSFPRSRPVPSITPLLNYFFSRV